MAIKTVKKIVVAGGGVLGSQIAFQSAYTGHDVTIWLRSSESIKRTEVKLATLKKTYQTVIKKMAKSPSDEWANGISSPQKFQPKLCLEKTNQAFSSIKLELDLTTALKSADILIESVAELKSDKINFYKLIAPLLESKTIIATNSSTLLPSTFAKYTGRADKYLAMHFANSIWKNNIAEIMPHAKTSKSTFSNAIKIAESINMVPVPIHKEKAGYLLNSMLVPFLLSGLDLYVNGIAEPEAIDRAWTISTGASKGPFRIIDTVGLITAYNIVKQYQKVPRLVNPLLKKMLLPYNFTGMKRVLQKYIDEGKLGRSAGEGFYKY